MVAESAGSRAHPVRPGGPDGKRYALLVRSDAAAILASCVSRLQAFGNPLTQDQYSRSALAAEALAIIELVAKSIALGEVRIDAGVDAPSWAVSPECSATLSDWTDAAAIFTDVALIYLARHVQNDPALLPSFMIAVMALNQSIARRSRTAADAFAVTATDRLHRAHLEERRRIARELHDRLGESLSAGLRRLDLQEIAAWQSRTPEHDDNGAKVARDVLVDAMSRLRHVTSDLRAAPVPGLEKAIAGYLDTVSTEADVQFRIEGDEDWVPASVRDEVFLILREAIRNALAHGAPQTVLIDLDLARDEVKAGVQDDGRGFAPGAPPGELPARTGTGLLSMHERAALIGGRLTISSRPGNGTRVDLWVPLPESGSPAGHPSPAAN